MASQLSPFVTPQTSVTSDSLSEISVLEGLGPNAEAFLANQTNENTRSAYRYDLEKWFLFCAGASKGQILVGETTVIRFRDYLTQNYSSRTAARVFNTVRAFAKWSGVNPNPFDRVKAPQRVRNAVPVVPPDEQVNDMLDYCDNPRDKKVLALLSNGLRASEVVGLNREDLQVVHTPEGDENYLRVLGKGNKERLIPLNSDAAHALAVDNPANARPSDPLVLSRSGGRLTRSMVRHIVEDWSIKAGQPFRPHRMRAQYITRLVRADVNLPAIQKLVGHASLASTQVYIGLDLRDLRNAVARDPRNNRE